MNLGDCGAALAADRVKSSGQELDVIAQAARARSQALC
jgi:hypothetical protein